MPDIALSSAPFTARLLSNFNSRVSHEPWCLSQRNVQLYFAHSHAEHADPLSVLSTWYRSICFCFCTRVSVKSLPFPPSEIDNSIILILNIFHSTGSAKIIELFLKLLAPSLRTKISVHCSKINDDARHFRRHQCQCPSRLSSCRSFEK